MPIIEGLDPIINHTARLLILGSMPSIESLRKNEYYAHPRNQFWRIIFSIFDSEFEVSYRVRTSLLKDKQIAIWDVIKRCEREGSSDSKISNVHTNDLATLLSTYPNIKNLCFNGQKAFNIFKKEVKLNAPTQITVRVLPSTSPANARMSLEAKIREWAIIKGLLLE